MTIDTNVTKDNTTYTEDANNTPNYTATLGPPSNFWLYSSLSGYDLTHPPTPTSPLLQPRLTLPTTSNTPITLSPSKTALLIIDMQNFFLSPAFGRDVAGPGHAALKRVVDVAVPAARRAGVQVVYVNWGLEEGEVGALPPALTRVFGFEAFPGGGEEKGEGKIIVDQGKNPKTYTGLGNDCGLRDDPYSGGKVDGGKLLIKNSWNADLYGPLGKLYAEGAKLATKPDVLIHKNRMSALWGEKTALSDFLEREGIRSLLFAGVNTDQCVGGTLQDAFSRGFDCVLLRDGAGTSSPEFAQRAVEFNAGKSWGFVSSCEEFGEGVERMMGGGG